VPDWNKLLDGSPQSAFVDGAPSGQRTLLDGSTIDLTQALNMANCQKVSACGATDLTALTTERPWGLNNPVWRLYSYGNLRDMLPATDTINSPYYVMVMVGDDPSDNDNNPLLDGAGLGVCPPGQV